MKMKKSSDMKLTAEQFPNLFASLASSERRSLQMLYSHLDIAVRKMGRAIVDFFETAPGAAKELAMRGLCAAYHRFRRAHRAFEGTLSRLATNKKARRRIGPQSDKELARLRWVVEDQAALIWGDNAAIRICTPRGHR